MRIFNILVLIFVSCYAHAQQKGALVSGRQRRDTIKNMRISKLLHTHNKNSSLTASETWMLIYCFDKYIPFASSGPWRDYFVDVLISLRNRIVYPRHGYAHTSGLLTAAAVCNHLSSVNKPIVLTFLMQYWDLDDVISERPDTGWLPHKTVRGKIQSFDAGRRGEAYGMMANICLAHEQTHVMGLLVGWDPLFDDLTFTAADYNREITLYDIDAYGPEQVVFFQHAIFQRFCHNQRALTDTIEVMMLKSELEHCPDQVYYLQALQKILPGVSKGYAVLRQKEMGPFCDRLNVLLAEITSEMVHKDTKNEQKKTCVIQ